MDLPQSQWTRRAVLHRPPLSVEPLLLLSPPLLLLSREPVPLLLYRYVFEPVEPQCLGQGHSRKLLHCALFAPDLFLSQFLIGAWHHARVGAGRARWEGRAMEFRLMYGLVTQGRGE